jgi:hypothetical protein
VSRFRFQFRLIDLLIVCVAWVAAWLIASSMYRERNDTLIRARIAYEECWTMSQQLNLRYRQNPNVKPSDIELTHIFPDRSCLDPWRNPYVIVGVGPRGAKVESLHVASRGEVIGKPFAQGTAPGELNSWDGDCVHYYESATTRERQAWVFRTACGIFPPIVIAFLAFGWVATRKPVSGIHNL